MADVLELRRPPQPPAPPNRVTKETFHPMAMAFIQANCETGAVPTIKHGSPECEAWGKYFDGHLGWQPWAFRALMDGSLQEMTVPTQWPEWFDRDYAGQ
jgi:hypothetical protein